MLQTKHKLHRIVSRLCCHDDTRINLKVRLYVKRHFEVEAVFK